MSRTFRRNRVSLDLNHKPIPVNARPYDLYSWRCKKIPIDYYSKRNYKADRKPWSKPSKSFKKEQQKIRNAKVKEAMRRGDYDIIPFFKKENVWLWN